MEIDIYQIDAFTRECFRGNPAAVCPLAEWLPDAQMQAIAAENNLAETAFLIPLDGNYHIRWFTPTVEVDLCGHATLAAAYVLKTYLNFAKDRVSFASRSGMLHVDFNNDGSLSLDFPLALGENIDPDQALLDALGAGQSQPKACLQSDDLLLIFETQAEIEQLQPDFNLLGQFPLRGIIVSAPGEDCDFVSRFFGPASGINEDPVTGSAHTKLVPYWAQALGKNQLHARQVSARGGELWCELKGERVLIRGFAVAFLRGKIFIDA